MNSRFFKISCIYSNSLKMSNVGEFFQELISWGTQPSLGKETKIKRFKLSTFKS